MLHKIKEATNHCLCQEQLAGCLPVISDINQSSDLVQWSEKDQFKNCKTTLWSPLIPVPICKKAMDYEHKVQSAAKP